MSTLVLPIICVPNSRRQVVRLIPELKYRVKLGLQLGKVFFRLAQILFFKISSCLLFFITNPKMDLSIWQSSICMVQINETHLDSISPFFCN